MRQLGPEKLTRWTVDFGNGPTPISVPHAWRQEVPVGWEGPAVYRTTVSGSESDSTRWILFHGVSYEARVLANGEELGTHRGLWDAFAFELPVSAQEIDVEVHVTKNGGARFPVREVASGFLPFVYHTFGGIYKEVEVVSSVADPSEVFVAESLPRRVRAEGATLWAPALAPQKSAAERAAEWVAARRAGIDASAQPTPNSSQTDGAPLYVRGVLTWGWYPSTGHCNPPETVIRNEIDCAKRLGFNLIKFCLWVPPHRYLEMMREAGLWAWIELPLWDPTDDVDAQEQMAQELERITRQYAGHPNIALWTCGCELHETTSAGYRQRLYETVRAATSQSLVKDNSGSAEMYGGDLREFGDFYDFHPYCDTPFYPEVLDSLLVGPRAQMPILLGEFNDVDVHRDLPRLRANQPYWASPDPILNEQGVRWQHDLPDILASNRFAADPEEHRHEALVASSKNKARFIRKYVQEAVRSRGDIGGYVVTGWRDTPISSAGMLDDWDEPRFSSEDLASWNGPSCLFQIPTRRPPWVRGGNRPGWIDPFNWFQGRVFWKIGLHSENPLEGHLEWDILHFTWENGKRPLGRVAHGTAEPTTVTALEPREVGQIAWEAEAPGGYLLRVRYGGIENSWPIWVVPKFDGHMLSAWHLDDPEGHYEGVTGFKSHVSDEGLAELSDLDIDAIIENVSIVSTRLGIDTIGAQRALVFLVGEDTKPMPFWRESAYEFSNASFWDSIGFREKWERLLPLTPDRAIDSDAVFQAFPGFDWETLLNRIDVRTYAEHPLLMRGQRADQRVILTTLRPFGGLGNCPRGIPRNPSGAEFFSQLLRAM